MNQDPQISDLLRALRDDTATLVREEISLARTELAEKAGTVGRSIACLGVGAMIASSALLLALIGLAYLLGEMLASRGISPGMAAFLGFLIVAAIVGGIGVTLVAKAIKAISDNSLTPVRTARSLREDKQWAQNRMS